MDPSYDSIYNTEAKRLKEAHTIFVQVRDDPTARDENGNKYSPETGCMSCWSPLTLDQIRSSAKSMQTAEQLQELEQYCWLTPELRERVKEITKASRMATEGERNDDTQFWRYACANTMRSRFKKGVPPPTVDFFNLDDLLDPALKVQSEDDDEETKRVKSEDGDTKEIKSEVEDKKWGS